MTESDFQDVEGSRLASVRAWYQREPPLPHQELYPALPASKRPALSFA